MLAIWIVLCVIVVTLLYLLYMLDLLVKEQNWQNSMLSELDRATKLNDVKITLEE